MCEVAQYMNEEAGSGGQSGEETATAQHKLCSDGFLFGLESIIPWKGKR